MHTPHTLVSRLLRCQLLQLLALILGVLDGLNLACEDMILIKEKQEQLQPFNQTCFGLLRLGLAVDNLIQAQRH